MRPFPDLRESIVRKPWRFKCLFGFHDWVEYEIQFGGRAAATYRLCPFCVKTQRLLDEGWRTTT